MSQCGPWSYGFWHECNSPCAAGTHSNSTQASPHEHPSFQNSPSSIDQEFYQEQRKQARNNKQILLLAWQKIMMYTSAEMTCLTMTPFLEIEVSVVVLLWGFLTLSNPCTESSNTCLLLLSAIFNGKNTPLSSFESKMISELPTKITIPDLESSLGSKREPSFRSAV